METFAPARPFENNPTFWEDRERALASLDLAAVDAPIQGIVRAFIGLPQCFTLQCCYGHFLWGARRDPYNTERLPAHGVAQVAYRIAYLAVCIEDSASGRHLRALLEDVPRIDKAYIQFGSPEWFWERQVNSYALQVEPARLQEKDMVTIDYQEALRVQDVRDLFFGRIAEILRTISDDLGPSATG